MKSIQYDGMNSNEVKKFLKTDVFRKSKHGKESGIHIPTQNGNLEVKEWDIIVVENEYTMVVPKRMIHLIKGL